jgi:alanine racemase
MKTYNLWIEIDLDRIKKNVRRLKARVGNDVQAMAIIKANAYGHGMCAVAHALADSVNYFGVSSFSEGEALRQEGILVPTLVLGSILPHDYEKAIEHDLSLTVSDSRYAFELNDAAARHGKKLKVHFKIDTGMGRWGFRYPESFQEIRELIELPHLDAEGIFTHFPVADNKANDYTYRQIELFKALLDECAKIGIVFPYVHAANSAGIINFPESHFNLIRPGITIYGYCPSATMCKDFNPECALSLKSRICLIKDFSPHRGISYGRSYVTRSRTRIAVVPIGYSHGYPYALSKKASVLINGKRFPIAGTVCMDYIMIDIGTDIDIAIGDEVVLIGRSGEEEITAYELAQKSDTLVYEIITNLSMNVPRIYFGGDTGA